MRSFSPSMIRVCTSTVSPTRNCGTSFLRYCDSTYWMRLLVMAVSGQAFANAPRRNEETKNARRKKQIQLFLRVSFVPSRLRGAFISFVHFADAPAKDRVGGPAF